MSNILVIIMAILQFVVSGDQFFKNNPAVGFMFLFYGAANVAYLFIIK